MTKRKVVETPEEIAVTVVEPVTVVEASKQDLKTKVAALIDEAPNLSAVQNNPWLYTEWLARLNGAVLNSK